MRFHVRILIAAALILAIFNASCSKKAPENMEILAVSISPAEVKAVIADTIFDLDLTDKQKEQVGMLLIATLINNQSTLKNYLDASKDMIEAITAKKYNPSKIKKAYKTYTKYGEQVALMVGEFYRDFRKILTSKQKKILDNFINNVLKFLDDPLSFFSFL